MGLSGNVGFSCFHVFFFHCRTHSKASGLVATLQYGPLHLILILLIKSFNKWTCLSLKIFLYAKQPVNYVFLVTRCVFALRT